MEDVELSVEDGIGYEVPEVPHIELVFQAVDDTLNDVAGQEGLLTNSQVYLQSILATNGVKNTGSVTGNEGFFSSVGNGLKAALEYIKKMFKAIWDFFFNRDADKKIADTKTEVMDTSKKLDDAAAGGTSPAQTEQLLKDQISVLKINGEGGGISIEELDALMTGAEAAQKGSDADKKAMVKKITAELPKLNQKARKKLDDQIDQSVAAIKAFLKLVKDTGEDKDLTPGSRSVISNLKLEVKTQEEMLKVLEAGRGMNSVEDAKRVLSEFIKDIQEYEGYVKEFKGMRGSVQTQITKLEAAVASTDKDNQATKDILADLKGQAAIISMLVKVMNKMLSRMSSTSITMQELFGVK